MKLLKQLVNDPVVMRGLALWLFILILIFGGTLCGN